jgi:hypothetical protein
MDFILGGTPWETPAPALSKPMQTGGCVCVVGSESKKKDRHFYLGEWKIGGLMTFDLATVAHSGWFGVW